jgi:hypothetical protein
MVHALRKGAAGWAKRKPRAFATRTPVDAFAQRFRSDMCMTQCSKISKEAC